MSGLQGNELDLGVVSKGARLPPNLRVTHRFTDRFCLIAPVKDGIAPPAVLRNRDFPAR